MRSRSRYSLLGSCLSEMGCEVGQDVELAARLLQEGKLVAFVTETVYGLGGHALNERAVANIFKAKERPSFDPLIVHIHELNQLTDLVYSVPVKAKELATQLWPGPLTIVLPKQPTVPDLVTSGLPSVAVRIPAHPIARQLLELANIPIAAPSANLFGQVSPTTAEHVAKQLGDRLDYILDGGPSTVGLESTVVSVVGDVVTQLRPGGTSLERLENIVGPVTVPTLEKPEVKEQAQVSPGMLSRHYAPRTPLVLVDHQHEIDQAQDLSQTGFLSWGAVETPERFGSVEVLSNKKDLSEAAANFFAALRRLDGAKLQMIYAERFPETGLGRALNDRLRRASTL